MTDRRRLYVLLGEPVSIDRFEGYSEVVASQLWFYNGDVTKGLPVFFYLLFFRRNNTGEFLLYDPLADGPRSLLGPQYVATSDHAYAFELLNQVSPELRRASLSLDPADPGGLDGTSSLGSALLIAKIHDLPKRSVRSDYLEAWLRYGRRVAAEYSFNFVPNRSFFAALIGPNRTSFVHYTIEIDAKDFALETDENRTKFYTTLDVSLEVTDGDGRLVTSGDNEVYLEFNPVEVQPVLVSPFAYQDSFPLIPGDYDVSVILKNRVLKRFTVAETQLHVAPIPSERPFVSDIVPAFGMVMSSGGARRDELRTFQVGALVLSPAADRVFVLGDTIHAFVQVLGPGAGNRLRFELLSGSDTLQARITELEDNGGGTVMERFPLTGMTGGNYVLRARLEDAGGDVLAERATDIVVSPRSALSRPWTYRRSFDTGRPGSVALARGEQFLALGRAGEADDTVDLIKFGPAGGELVKRIPVGIFPNEIEGPHGIKVAPGGRYWFVSIAHGMPYGHVFKYEAGVDVAVADTQAGLFPATMDISPTTGFLFVVNFNLHGDHVPSNVSVIDTVSMTEIARIEQGIMPHGSRVSPDGRFSYSVAMMSNELFEIDAMTLDVSRRLKLTLDDGSATVKPTWVQPHPTKPLAYVAFNGASQVVEVDLKRFEIGRRFHTNAGPYNLAVSPDGKTLVVTEKSNHSTAFWDLDSGKERKSIPCTNKITHGVTITPDSRFAFVTVEGVGGDPGLVEVYDLQDLERRAVIEVGKQASGIDFWKMEEP